MERIERLQQQQKKADDKLKALKKAIREEKRKTKEKERKALNHLKLKFAEEYFYYQKLKAENEGHQPLSYEQLYENAKRWSANQEKIKKEKEGNNKFNFYQ